MKKISFISLIFLFLGVLCGILFPEIVLSLDFIGTIYINLLKFMIIPIIFTSIMSTIYKSKGDKHKIILKSIIIFVIMFVISFLITSLVCYIAKPGVGYSFVSTEWNGTVIGFDFKEIILNLVPSSIVNMIENNNIFFVIVFSILFGFCATKVEKGDKVIEFVDGVKNILAKILEYVLWITPLAVFTLVGCEIANYGSVLLGVGIKYILTAYLCSLLVLILVMILPVWIICHVNPFTYIKKVFKVWINTVTTCSSLATLPLTIKTCNEEFNVPNKVTDIVVPLGCTIHMCGGAVSFAILTFFCTQLYGFDINITTYIFMLVSALIINMAAPGIHNGGIVIGASYLYMFDIPISFIGFYSGIYKLLDMSYTTLNVTGDITANLLINKYK